MSPSHTTMWGRKVVPKKNTKKTKTRTKLRFTLRGKQKKRKCYSSTHKINSNITCMKCAGSPPTNLTQQMKRSRAAQHMCHMILSSKEQRATSSHRWVPFIRASSLWSWRFPNCHQPAVCACRKWQAKGGGVADSFRHLTLLLVSWNSFWLTCCRLPTSRETLMFTVTFSCAGKAGEMNGRNSSGAPTERWLHVGFHDLFAPSDRCPPPWAWFCWCFLPVSSWKY